MLREVYCAFSGIDLEIKRVSIKLQSVQDYQNIALNAFEMIN